MDNVTYGNFARETDPQMTNVAGAIWEQVGLPKDTPKVLLNPSSPGYEAQLLPNGTLKVGQEGVNDFEELFGVIGQDQLRLHTLGLYVVYSTYRYALSETLKYNTGGLHAAMGELAQDIKQEEPMFAKQNVHAVEGILNGWYAARQARKTIVELTDRTNEVDGTQEPLTESRKQLLNSQIISVALENHNKEKSYKGRDKPGRKRVLGHFALSLNGVSTDVEQRIDQIIKDIKRG